MNLTIRILKELLSMFKEGVIYIGNVLLVAILMMYFFSGCGFLFIIGLLGAGHTTVALWLFIVNTLLIITYELIRRLSK